jgi:hypothetical protein
MTAGATGELVAAALGHESSTTARPRSSAGAVRELEKVPARSRELSEPPPPR